MSKSAKIKLHKEFLKLKIKQQEFEIKKTALDLQRRYDPIQLGIGFITDLISGDDELDAIADQVTQIPNPELQRAVAKASLRRRQRRKQMRNVTDLFTNLMMTLKSFVSLGKDALPEDEDDIYETRKKSNKKSKNQPPPDPEEYIIGRDDL